MKSGSWKYKRLCMAAIWMLCGALWLGGFSGCPERAKPSVVVELDQHTARLPAGVPYTPERNGYFLSDEVLGKLLQRLEDLQYKLDSMPKAELYYETTQMLFLSANYSDGQEVLVRQVRDGLVFFPKGKS